VRGLVPLLTAIWLSGATALAQEVRPAKCAFSAPPLDQPAPVLLGWSDLERERLPPGVQREVRLHTGVAIAVPDYSLRLADLGNRVTGEILVHWPGVDYERVTGGDPGCQAWHEAERRQLSQRVAQSRREHYRCSSVKVVPRVQGCRITFAAEPDWAEMLREADSLGVWSLDSLPLRLELDGSSVSVELRDQAGYRRYDYRNPDPSGTDVEKRVAALAALLQAGLQSAASQARTR
jgi:hypothetical protein